MREPPGGSTGTIRRGRHVLLGYEKRKLPGLPDGFAPAREVRVCTCGLHTDNPRCSRHCYVCRSAYATRGWWRVVRAADKAARTAEEFIPADAPEKPVGDFRLGDYHRLYTKATSTSKHARPGDHPQPWHPRSELGWTTDKPGTEKAIPPGTWAATL